MIRGVFRGLKDGDWLGWGPMHHWTDSKIRVHAFYCMLGISLLQHIHRKAEAAWAGLSIDCVSRFKPFIPSFVLALLGAGMQRAGHTPSSSGG